METITSLTAYVDALFRADTDLATAMGGEARIHPVWQPEDTTMPYIVQIWNMASTAEPYGLRNATLSLHLWSKQDDMSQCLKIRQRCAILLDQRHIKTPDVNTARCSLVSEGAIPDEPGIWHYVLQFNVRLYRASEVDAIIDRDKI